MARQKLGQHFLANPGWQSKIFKTLGARDGELWVEIGPGHGEITEPLARSGARVIAIETDVRLADHLRANAASWGNVEVIEANVLTIDFAKLTPERFHVYGSLPYYITSPILRRLFEAADHVASIHVVIQLEVAARIVARPGRREFGYLSAVCQFYAKPQLVFKIPAGAFRPPPRVTSALVRMDLPGERANLRVDNESRFLEFVLRCFGHKRKTLRNNLRDTVEKERFDEALNSSGISPEARAEQLSLQQFATLYSAISTK
jgi:16S rRNA (adenine1518-N6/adenine1519-N6)-dimethyltransferase